MPTDLERGERHGSTGGGINHIDLPRHDRGDSGGRKMTWIIAIWDEFNHAILPPEIATCIQPRHQVPKHGLRLILEETEKGDRSPCVATSMKNEIEVLGYWPGKWWKQARAVVSRAGLAPTVLSEMGAKGNNFVWITESNSPGRSTDTASVKPTTSTRSKG